MPEPMLVDKRHDRHEFFQPILERCPGEDNGVRRRDPFHAPGGPRVPVLDALRFVENHQVRRPLADEVEIGVYGVVVRDFEEAVRRRVLLLASGV